MNTKPNQPNLKLQNALSRLLGPCLISALLVLAGTGCKHEAGGNANLDLTGIYVLVSVDGKTVPCNVTHEGVAITVKSGLFTLQADGHCNSQSIFSVPPGRDVSREVKATYMRQGAELTMQWEGAGMTKGNVNGNTFTMTNEGMVFAYRK
jgi:hypothetical protein